jgi:hypothetical protein
MAVKTLGKHSILGEGLLYLLEQFAAGRACSTCSNGSLLIARSLTKEVSSGGSMRPIQDSAEATSTVSRWQGLRRDITVPPSSETAVREDLRAALGTTA